MIGRLEEENKIKCRKEEAKGVSRREREREREGK